MVANWWLYFALFTYVWVRLGETHSLASCFFASAFPGERREKKAFDASDWLSEHSFFLSFFTLLSLQLISAAKQSKAESMPAQRFREESIISDGGGDDSVARSLHYIEKCYLFWLIHLGKLDGWMKWSYTQGKIWLLAGEKIKTVKKLLRGGHIHTLALALRKN